jgi:hypothetical protein
MSEQASFQQLLVTNFGLSPSGYAGSRGDVGYVGSGGVLGYTGSIGPAGAGASVPKITAIAYSSNDTATNPAGGDTITITGSGFLAGATVVINGAQAGVVSVVNSATITFTAPPNSAGSYIVYVVNTDGTTALLVPGIQYSGTPTWTTAAGSLGSVSTSTSITITVAATGDAPITYSVYSGTLPSGVSLNTTSGVISGTTPALGSTTTYNFTIRATDAQLQDTDRVFSLTVAPEPAIGQSYGGGYYAGKISTTGDGVATHYLIVCPKASGTGQYSYSTAGGSGDPTSIIDGPTNSSTMNNASHPAAQFCEGLTINGYSDWYLPARNELMVIYYNLKPDTTASYSERSNPYSVPPMGTFSTGNPSRTSVSIFQAGGSEALDNSPGYWYYWSSTQSPSGTNATAVNFQSGYDDPNNGKTNPYIARAVRRVAI